MAFHARTTASNGFDGSVLVKKIRRQQQQHLITHENVKPTNTRRRNGNTQRINSSSSNSRSVQLVVEEEEEEDDDTRPIMLFDGVCNLCDGGVSFVRNNDHKGSLRYVALQSQMGRDLLVRRCGRSPDDISSVVLVEKDSFYLKSQAVLKIMTYLDLPFPQLAFFLTLVPLFVRDFAYDNVANNRYLIFGRSENSCDLQQE